MVVKRFTKQRAEVREALIAADGFVSAQQLHRKMQTDGSSIGLATVYRNLAGLVEAKEADQLFSPEGENLYRFCSTDEHHHHLICNDCGSTEEIAAKPVEDWAKRTASEHGFTATEHVIDIFGTCGDCTI